MDEDKLFQFHYTYSESEDKSSCRHCSSKFVGKNLSNLKRHTQKIHPERAKETNLETKKRKPGPSRETEQEPQKKVRKLSRGDLIQSCVELATLNLVPYYFFSYVPFLRLIEIHKDSAKVGINPQSVQEFVSQTAEQIKESIKEELKNKMIGLKLDVATRLGRSMLGVNTQFFSHEEHAILIRSIGMKEIKTRHTASTISIMISDLLRSFEVDQRSISSITCDNGRNIVASAKLFQEHQNSLLLNDEIEALREQENEFLNDEEDEREFDNNGPSDIPLDIQDALKSITSIAVLVRCSIHTLQLAVHDALKDIKERFGTELNDIRKVLKNLNSSVYIQRVTELDLIIPGLDVITRWNSSYTMIHKLIAVKEKIIKLYDYYENAELDAIKLDSTHWAFMNEFHVAFKPCYELTVKLQSTQIGIGTNKLAFHFHYLHSCIFFSITS